MRMGVIDVGSNTVHLLVVDAFWGAHPIPASKYKVDLRLFDHMDEGGVITDEGAGRLLGFVRECLDVAEDYGVESLMGFATSAIRESPNGDEVLERIRKDTGVELVVLSGGDEARLTFLAARRWHGWSAGRIFMLDIGGGSLELASGIDEDPDVALSLPLGAGRITREHLPGDPPKPATIKKARKLIRTEIARVMRDLNKVGEPDLFVGTSKTIRSLARLTGAAPSTEGIYTRRSLSRTDLKEVLPQLAAMSQDKRAALPGVSGTRSRQVLAGAMVVEAVMDLAGIDELCVCPWALREGVILQQLDLIPAPRSFLLSQDPAPEAP